MSARGVVLLQRLLLDSGGPLYDVDQEDELADLSGRGPRRTRTTLMVELLGIVIAVACFLAAFGLFILLDRV